MLVLYLLLIGISGLLPQLLLRKLKIINTNNINIIEYISQTFFMGIFMFIMYFMILGFFEVKFSNIVFLTVLIVDIFSVLITLLTTKKTDFKKITKSKKDILPIVLIIIIFGCYALYAYSHLFLHADSFAVWGMNAKNYFIGKSMQFSVGTNLENYPPLLPGLYFGYYLLVGAVKENVIKIIPVVITFFGMLNIVGILNRKNVSIHKSLYIMIAFMLVSEVLKKNIASSYGDISLGIFYSLGTLYFIDMIFSKNYKENGVLAIIYLNMACLCKREILYMLAMNFLIAFIYLIFFRKNKAYKVPSWFIFLVCALSLICGGLWNVFCDMFSSEVFSNTAVISGISSTISYYYIPTVIRSMNTVLFQYLNVCIVFIIILIGLFKNLNFSSMENKKNSLYLLMILSFIIFTVVFLFMCYISVFAETEAVLARSFERYMTRILFLALYYIIILLEKGRNGDLKLYE